MSLHEHIFEGKPPSINPYKVLGLETSSTADQVKSAYRKAALINHPDKVPEDKKVEAHEKFQAIALAYAVLSDPLRRKRYDETGSTSESIVDSDGFSWSDFYREQFRDAVSEDVIQKFAKKYKGSCEEKDDILAAYVEFEGDMDRLYESVMLSNVLEDDERFRKIIDVAIAAEKVEAFAKYCKETKRSKQARVKAAQKEASEAEEYAKELGIHDKLFATKKNKKDSDADLAALIKKNSTYRQSSFLDALEDKYGAKSKTKAGRKRSTKEACPDDDIDEDEFQRIRASLTMNSKAKKQRSDRGKK